MTYIVNRLLSIVLTLWLISVITFAVTSILPGDVAMMILGTQSNPTALAGLREQLGLNDSLVVQYGRWIGGMLTGDFGHSLVFKEPISELMAQKMKASALIVVMSMAIALICAVPLGVWAAVHRRRWQDSVSSSAALLGISLPDFFWGIMMILLFARTLGWFPSSGFTDPSVDFVGALRHAFLPSLALGLGLMAHLTRVTRSTMTGILNQEFIRVARAKGLAERRVIWRHALRNAAVPLVTVVVLSYASLLEGSVLTEIVFSWPGIGSYITNALQNADMSAVLGGTLIIGSVFIALNLLSDVLYRALDPRTRVR